MRNEARRRQGARGEVEPHRLAIAEDDHEVRLALAQLLALDGFEVTHVGDGDQLVEHLRESRQEHGLPDLLVLDHRMPGRTGLEVLETLGAVGLEIPVILISAFGDEIRQVAQARGARAVLDKPFDPHDLLTAIYYFLGSARRAPSAAARALPDPLCAACGDSRRICLDPRTESLYLCTDCQERAAPPGALDDLGEGD
jgi:CheY-like chemotaxis protein